MNKPGVKPYEWLIFALILFTFLYMFWHDLVLPWLEFH